MRHHSASDAEREPEPDSDSPPTARPRARQVRDGAVGGLVATLVMTAYRLPISRSLPPTARLWALYVAGGDEDDHPVPAVVLHLLYGTVAGALFGAAGALLGGDPTPTADDDAEARREEVGLLAGVGYALALSWFGERVLLRRLLGMDPDRDESLVFHVGHVIYGLTLGTWIGSRVSHPEDG
ncbi:hypothetical protein M0R88_09865 [Halorussus gelatinilyticus]|uniref:Uncharacterized protein n=1 Tax=Halorussus gelatinilyticus TaxID=2937524 RepID=A0A8U0IFK4_9EURY|nr:hypothetical protein [Halorussus gelatinilyticus]UPV98838.1 hypothetical protein M0R88_09865 [Halorussus gelatinilyticus]